MYLKNTILLFQSAQNKQPALYSTKRDDTFMYSSSVYVLKMFFFLLFQSAQNKQPALLLILDRRDDPVTPLLNQV
jgi:hypothetical protein